MAEAKQRRGEVPDNPTLPAAGNAEPATAKIEERDWATDEAEALVDSIRRQNWKNGGIHVVDRNDAVELLALKLRLANLNGRGEGLDLASRAMDAVFKRPSTRTP